MRKAFGVLAMTMLVAGCDAMPKDAEGTLPHIEASHEIRVGLIADPAPLQPDRAQALIAALAQQTGARPIIETGAGERLLDRLGHGDLDIVLGTFTEETPWADTVALGPPLAITGPKDRRLMLRAAARNGENAWIVRIERASRRIAPAEARE